ncbi:AIR synthase-related protein [Amycolatopsis sp. NPDC059657]|uniref:AIR synthase-related protein n=1 Tax=Amycolatopsis sp. NPDC059657 TaxID=3346899 RepID=UPI00366D5978
MIHKFSVRTAGAAEPDVERAGRDLGLPDLEIWHDYYIQFATEPGAEGIAAVCDALHGPIGKVTVADVALADGEVQVAYRRGVVDNESDSLVAMCAALGLDAVAGKMATSYKSSSPKLAEIIRATRFNQTIEELHETEPRYETLMPSGHYEPARYYDLTKLSDEELAELGKAEGRNLSLAQMKHIRGIQEQLGTESVTDVLFEALDARWSDHCAHTTWKSLGSLLGRLVAASKDTQNPNILSMFHDNAGVWDFYEDHAIAVKAETHNGPSAISAYFGQLTKLGGVLRDILGTGLVADPIGSFEYTALGVPETPAPIAGRPAPRQIASDTIRAIKEYGNTFGVPMTYSHMTFHPAYRAKPFALGGSIGIMPTSAAQPGTPQPGDLVVLIGGLTGNEGMHGASASSAGSTMDVTSVQIGAPLEQVKFRKALVDLRDAGCLRALTDVGGAGLNSAVGEIGDPGGVWINTALVPLKTSALPMWRILLSESQERMLLAIPPSEYAAASRILKRHQVRTTAIGRFTDTGRYTVFHQPALTEADVLAQAEPGEFGELGFDVPYEMLDFDIPRIETGPVPTITTPAPSWPSMAVDEIGKLLEQVVADAEVASQHYADSQYDSTVQGNTFYGPQYGGEHRVSTGYWAGTPVDGSRAAAVLSTAFNPWLFDVHPVDALRQMFVDVVAGQVLAGVALNDICLTDNFYTPHLAENWQEWLVGMVDELALLVRHFGVPVISGKDSSAGSTATDEGVVSVPPAVFLTALGKAPDAAELTPEQWTGAGSVLALIGPRTPSPVATVAGRLLGVSEGPLDSVDLSTVDAYLAALAASRGGFRSATRIGPGGVAAGLVKGALASGLGVELNPEAAQAELLFAEHRAGALVELDEATLASLPEALNAVVLGRLVDETGVRVAGTELLTPAVADRWTGSFTARIA